MPFTKRASKLRQVVDELVQKNKVVIFSRTSNESCEKAKRIFENLKEVFVSVELDHEEHTGALKEALKEKTSQDDVPQVFVKGQLLGGSRDTEAAFESGVLQQLLSMDEDPGVGYDYDLVVIGSGPGGVAAAKKSARLGQKVALCDNVKPSSLGTTWGLRGVCVTVGCIPTAIMRQTRIRSEMVKDADCCGQLSAEVHCKWATAIDRLSRHVDSVNESYVKQLKSSVAYFTGHVEFVDPHTVKVGDTGRPEETITATNFILATETYTNRNEIPGGNAPGSARMTSEDLISLSYCPGQTLIVGKSYGSLEWATFLNAMGLAVTVMVESDLLPGLDEGVAERIAHSMKQRGLRLLRPCKVEKVEKLEDGFPGKVQVAADFAGMHLVERYNTVLLATEQTPCNAELRLEKAGLRFTSDTGKIPTEHERTNVAHIFAIGEDLQEGQHAQLTPVAVEAGFLLARRLFTSSQIFCDYGNLPPAVFPALDYGCFGYSEQDARRKFGSGKVNVHETAFAPMEWAVANQDGSEVYAKLVCLLPEDRIVGFHYIGPDAEEVTRSFAAAVRPNPAKKRVSSVVHRHPICAEIITTLKTRGTNHGYMS